MLTESATVVSVDAGSVRLRTSRRATCSGCSLRSGCGQYLLARDKHEVLAVGIHDQNIIHAGCLANLKQGDKVNLGIEKESLLTLAGMFYLLPLGSLLLATALARVGNAAESMIIASALLALAAGFLVSRYYLKKSGIGFNLSSQPESATSEPAVLHYMARE